MSLPWHDEARRLRAAGSSLAEIGRIVSRHYTTVRWALDEGDERKKHAARAKLYHERHHRREWN